MYTTIRSQDGRSPEPDPKSATTIRRALVRLLRLLAKDTAKVLVRSRKAE